jgi:hypothetical protein
MMVVSITIKNVALVMNHLMLSVAFVIAMLAVILPGVAMISIAFSD